MQPSQVTHTAGAWLQRAPVAACCAHSSPVWKATALLSKHFVPDLSTFHMVRFAWHAAVGEVHDGDAVVTFNFRADRMVELSQVRAGSVRLLNCFAVALVAVVACPTEWWSCRRWWAWMSTHRSVVHVVHAPPGFPALAREALPRALAFTMPRGITFSIQALEYKHFHKFDRKRWPDVRGSSGGACLLAPLPTPACAPSISLVRLSLPPLTQCPPHAAALPQFRFAGMMQYDGELHLPKHFLVRRAVSLYAGLVHSTACLRLGKWQELLPVTLNASLRCCHSCNGACHCPPPRVAPTNCNCTAPASRVPAGAAPAD